MNIDVCFMGAVYKGWGGGEGVGGVYFSRRLENLGAVKGALAVKHLFRMSGLRS